MTELTHLHIIQEELVGNAVTILCGLSHLDLNGPSLDLNSLSYPVYQTYCGSLGIRVCPHCLESDVATMFNLNQLAL